MLVPALWASKWPVYHFLELLKQGWWGSLLPPGTGIYHWQLWIPEHDCPGPGYCLPVAMQPLPGAAPQPHAPGFLWSHHSRFISFSCALQGQGQYVTKHQPVRKPVCQTTERKSTAWHYSLQSSVVICGHLWRRYIFRSKQAITKIGPSPQCF